MTVSLAFACARPWQGFEVEVKGKLAALVGGELFPQAHYSSG